MSDTLDFKPNDSIGLWTVIKKIGDGTYGLVFKCNNSLGQIAAVKVSKHDEDTRHEASILKFLSGSAGVVEFYDEAYYEDCSMIAMEYAGKNLHSLRRTSPNRKFGIPTLQKISYQLLTVLEILDQKKIVHGDLKGMNICVSHPPGPNNEVVLSVLDFGSAANLNTGELSGIDWKSDKKASPFIPDDEKPKPIDDLNQLLYVLLHMAGHPLREIFNGSWEDGYQFKLGLVNKPRSVLSEEYSWMFYLLQQVGFQAKNMCTDYPVLFEAVQWFDAIDHSKEFIKWTKNGNDWTIA